MENEETFVKILATNSLSDISLIKSVLEAEEIEYFLQGENMLFIRPFIEPAILMVAEKDSEKVRELLKPLPLSYTWIHG